MVGGGVQGNVIRVIMEGYIGVRRVQRRRFFVWGNREVFRRDDFWLGFIGCVGVCQVEKGFVDGEIFYYSFWL